MWPRHPLVVRPEHGQRPVRRWRSDFGPYATNAGWAIPRRYPERPGVGDPAAGHHNRRDGTTLTLPTLSGDGASALAVNDRGQAVGESGFMSTKNPTPVLWQHGEVFNLAVRGVGGKRALGINDRGEIIGTGYGQIPDAVLYIPGS
jgi:hypothetical protein